MNLSRSEIHKEALLWINNEREFAQEMNVLEDSLVEYEYCYSFDWCIKGEENLEKEWPTFVGIGKLLISKDGKLKDFGGSAPGMDWIHHFELEIQGLEDYWYLEIPFDKQRISTFKSAIQCSTTALLKMVDKNQKIVYTEAKAWNDHFPQFQQIADDLNESGIECQVEIRTREKLAGHE